MQTLQRYCDEIRTVLDQSRESTATQETELARLRSEATASQQIIDTLRRQLETNTAATRDAQLRSSQGQQRGMQPPAKLPSYSSAPLGTPFPSSNYDSRPPNYSYVGSLQRLTSSYVRQRGGTPGIFQSIPSELVIIICIWTRS